MKLTFTIRMTRSLRNPADKDVLPEADLDFLLAFLAHEAKAVDSLEFRDSENNVSTFKTVFVSRRRVNDVQKYCYEFKHRLAKFKEDIYWVFNLNIRVNAIEFTPDEWKKYSAMKVLVDKLGG